MGYSTARDSICDPVRFIVQDLILFDHCLSRREMESKEFVVGMRRFCSDRMVGMFDWTLQIDRTGGRIIKIRGTSCGEFPG